MLRKLRFQMIDDIAGEVEAVEGRGNRIVRHPQRKCGDAKGEVGGGGPVVELGRVAETLKGEP